MKGLLKEDFSFLASSNFYWIYFAAIFAVMTVFFYTTVYAWLLSLVVLVWFFSKIHQDRNNPFFQSLPFSCQEYVKEKYLMILLLVIPAVGIISWLASSEHFSRNLKGIPAGLVPLNLGDRPDLNSYPDSVYPVFTAKISGIAFNSYNCSDDVPARFPPVNPICFIVRYSGSHS